MSAIAVLISPRQDHLLGLGFESALPATVTSSRGLGLHKNIMASADNTPVLDNDAEDFSDAVAQRGRMDSVYSTPPIGVQTSPQIPVRIFIKPASHK